jgi:hypothetical protein
VDKVSDGISILEQCTGRRLQKNAGEIAKILTIIPMGFELSLFMMAVTGSLPGLAFALWIFASLAPGPGPITGAITSILQNFLRREKR